MVRSRLWMVVFLLGLGSARADILVPESSLAGGSPSSPGDGLNAAFYANTGSLFTNAAAYAFIASNSATATYVSTGVDYPAGSAQTLDDSSTLADLLGTDAASLQSPSAGSSPLAQTLHHFTGFINIAAAGTYQFLLSSDDGSGLSIGGVAIINNEGDHGFNPVSEDVVFSKAGLYAIDLIYYENFGVTGVEFSSNLTGQSAIVPQSLLYTSLRSVPEPPGLALLGVGLVVAGARAFRRNRRRCPA